MFAIKRRWPQHILPSKRQGTLVTPHCFPWQQSRANQHLVVNFCSVSTLCRRRCCCHIIKLNIELVVAALIVHCQVLTVVGKQIVEHVRYWRSGGGGSG